MSKLIFAAFFASSAFFLYSFAFFSRLSPNAIPLSVMYFRKRFSEIKHSPYEEKLNVASSSNSETHFSTFFLFGSFVPVGIKSLDISLNSSLDFLSLGGIRLFSESPSCLSSMRHTSQSSIIFFKSFSTYLSKFRNFGSSETTPSLLLVKRSFSSSKSL